MRIGGTEWRRARDDDARRQQRNPKVGGCLRNRRLGLQGFDEIRLGVDAPGAAELDEIVGKKVNEAPRLPYVGQQQRLLKFA